MRRRKPYVRSPEIEEILTVRIGVLDESPPQPKKQSLRVLLLEDREDFRSILHEYLYSRSHRVTAVGSGIEGLREIMKAPFDLIICDMMMPKMGGEMFYWAVTRIRLAAGQRFIFYTGHRDNPAVENFFRRIRATVVLKPFSLTALEDAMRDVLRKLA
jgi:CheY-like chemotaxis protein